MLKPLLCVLFSFIALTGHAQLAASEKSAFKDMEKHRWHKAESRLRKSLVRDTLNPSTRYALAVFYFEPGNPAFDIDSAYRYVAGALDNWQQTSVRERDRLQKGGIDSLRMAALRMKIDSAAFEVAKTINTEAAYLQFLSQFPHSVHRDLAIRLRDDVAYHDALAESSYQALESYITRYPESHRVGEARDRYHQLVYAEKTKDNRLASYERFLIEYPESPYRREVYRNIFEITTAYGKLESFLSFMNRYPESEFAMKACDIAFHLLAEDEDANWPEGFLTDSLQSVLKVNDTYLVPFLKDGLFGFMDEHGNEVITPRYHEIHDDYLCGFITDELLMVDNGLVARNGHNVFSGPITDLFDIGVGFLKVVTDHDIKVVHKSGFELADSLDDARVIAARFVAIKRRDEWFLYAINGRLLDDRPWDDITTMGEVIVFSKKSQKFIAPRGELARGAADGRRPQLSEPFDELTQWPNGLIWGRSRDYEGVMDQALQTVIRFDKHTLTPAPFGAVAKAPNGFVVFNHSGRRSTVFDQVSLLAKSLAVKKGKQWSMYDPFAHRIVGRSYDSLRAEGAFVVGTRADSVYVLFHNNTSRGFFRPRRIAFVPGRDSTSFITVQENATRKSVFDLGGRKLFNADFESLEYAGSGLFVITRKDKKGLVDLNGKTRLPAEYDAIGTMKDNIVSLLKNKRFGSYNAASNKVIKPQYDRNLMPYGSSCVVTYKDGYYGLLGWDNKPISAFEFEEVSYWNDSLALVKKGSLWSLFDIANRKLVETNLRKITLVKDGPGEKLAVIQRNNDVGVISNQGKIIIPLNFTEIINLGSPDAPLYFAEKHVPEASMYIVIYYDRKGEMIRKEIYGDAADYDRIYCSN